MPVTPSQRRIQPRSRILTANDLNTNHLFNQNLIGWWIAQPALAAGITWTNILPGYPGNLTNMAANALGSGWGGTQRPGGIAEVRCDGQNDTVQWTANDGQALFGGQSVLTLSVWIFEIASQTGLTWLEYNPNNSTFSLENNSSAIQFWVNNLQNVSTSLIVGAWNHMVLMIDGTNQKIFRNGVLMASSAFSSSLTNANGIFILGGRVATRLVHSNFDDLHIWHRAFTNEDIAELYALSLVGYPGLFRSTQQRTITAASATATSVNPPAIQSRAQVPVPLIPKRLLTPSIQARAQMPSPLLTQSRQMPAIRSRARMPAPKITLGRNTRPDNPLLTSTFIPGDFLIQAPNIQLKYSFDFQEADDSWDHRIMEISPIEIAVPPGGGIATVANVTIKVAEDRLRQSILNKWQAYTAINGIPITIDFLINSPMTFAGVSNPLRLFTGKIDTITLQNAITDILCVDDSIQQNLMIPQTLVTSAAFPSAASAAYAQPEPLIYGAGSNIGAAPMLLVDIPTNTYLIAGHPMYLGSGNIAVWDQANTTFMAASGVMTFANDASALITFGVFNAGVLSWGSAVGVTNGGNAVDGNSTTIALINTATVDSNLAGYGMLGVFQVSAGVPNTSTIQVTFTNHRRSPGSDPTVNGTFYIQTVNPLTGALLRSLYTSPAFRHVTSAQTDVVTLTNNRIAVNEQLEVLLIARNDGTPGAASQTYEVGEIGVAGIVTYSATSTGLTTMTLPINTQEIRFNTMSYTLALDADHTDSFVITPSNAIDLLSTTYAILPTCALDSNLDGIGVLTVATPVTPIQLGNNTLSIDFTNHRRVLQSNPTVTGTFFVQTVNPATGVVLRDNLFVSPPYRQQLNPLSTSFTATGVNLGANEQVAVRLVARNEGGIGSYTAALTSGTSVTTLTNTVSVTSAFGTLGSGTGQFQTPTYIAIDSGSNVWVTDQRNNRVQQFDRNGTFLQAFGASGYGPGNFLLPLGIAVDSANQVYVVDVTQAMVQVFTSTGTVLTTFGTFGSGNGQFFSPWGIAADISGGVWVTDIANNTVQQFTSAGVYVQQFGSAGSGAGQFTGAAGIAVDTAGTLFVADATNTRIQVFSTSGVYSRQFGSYGTGNGQFVNPLGVAVGISGTVWVTDATNNTVQRFASAGSYLLTAASGGAGTGQFNQPLGIVTGASNLFWVVDQNNNRIQQFTVSFTSSTSVVASEFSGANDAYQVGEIGIKSFYQPPGGNMPVFLYGASWFGRYDPNGLILSYAGQPSGTFFHTPDEVIASILAQEMGRSVTTSAFANAFTWYANVPFTLDGGIGAGWAVAREQARKVLGDAAQQGTAILHPNFDATWRIVPFRSDTPIHLGFGVSNILLAEGEEKKSTGLRQDTMQITLGNLQLVHNIFEIQYAYNAGSRTYGKVLRVDRYGSTLTTSSPFKILVENLCLQSFNRFGDLAPLILPAYWIADDYSAQYLLAFLVQYFSGQRTFVEFDTTFYAMSLQVGDFITVTHPLLPDADNGGTFEVHTIRYLALQGRIHIIASKVATLAIIVKPEIRSRARTPAPIITQTAASSTGGWSEAWEYPDLSATQIFQTLQNTWG